MARTHDGKKVKAGDKVWVIGSRGVHETTVLKAVTSYSYFGPIPVDQAFSTKKAAEKARSKPVRVY